MTAALIGALVMVGAFVVALWFEDAEHEANCEAAEQMTREFRGGWHVPDDYTDDERAEVREGSYWK